jgi:hypothetical protein
VTARSRKLINDLGERFGILPGAMGLLGILLALVGSDPLAVTAFR